MSASDTELLAFVLGFIVGTALVGALVLVNARMKAGERKAAHNPIPT